MSKEPRDSPSKTLLLLAFSVLVSPQPMVASADSYPALQHQDPKSIILVQLRNNPGSPVSPGHWLARAIEAMGGTLELRYREAATFEGLNDQEKERRERIYEDVDGQGLYRYYKVKFSSAAEARHAFDSLSEIKDIKSIELGAEPRVRGDAREDPHFPGYVPGELILELEERDVLWISSEGEVSSGNDELSHLLDRFLVVGGMRTQKPISVYGRDVSQVELDRIIRLNARREKLGVFNLVKLFVHTSIDVELAAELFEQHESVRLAMPNYLGITD